MTPKTMAALSLAAAVVVAGQPARAASRHGGGSRSGGPRVVAGARPAGHAVRSAPSYATRGTIAERRHPRAGTGRYYRPGYGSYRPYYGGSRRPFYGRYYRPYRWGWGGSFGASLYLGWPYWWGGYYYPGYYPPYGYGYDYGYDYGYGYPSGDYGYPGYAYAPGDRPYPPDADAPAYADRDAGRLRLDVQPDDATVYVDDAFRGTAREARQLRLPPGRHLVELVRPGFAVERREVTVASGETTELDVELQRR